MKKTVCYALTALIILSSCARNEGGSRTALPSFTLLWYVNGSDLESGGGDPDSGGAFSENLAEMLSVLPRDERFNVVIFTGGASDWKTEGFSAAGNQLHAVTSGGLIHGEMLPEGSIAEPEILAAFIKSAVASYPASRYGLIFWDHGSGAPIGFGYDELREPQYMDLQALSQGLRDGLDGLRLDFVGFDACLMASAEVASACAPYADYLIASEELEPFGGWDYSALMRALSGNTGIGTTELARAIIDGYFKVSRNRQETLTLSAVALKEIAAVSAAAGALAGAAGAELGKGGFNGLSRVRAGTKYYGGVRQSVDMVDIVHLAERMREHYPEESDELIKAVRECVVLNRHTENAADSGGLSIYFPYDNPGVYYNFLEPYTRCGFNEEYIDFVESFAVKLRLGHSEMRKLELPVSVLSRGSVIGARPDFEVLKSHNVLLREESGSLQLIGLDTGTHISGGSVYGAVPGGWLSINGLPAFAYSECGDGDTVMYSVPVMLNDAETSLELACENGTFSLLCAVPESRDGRVPLPVSLPVQQGDSLRLRYPVINEKTQREGEKSYALSDIIDLEGGLRFELVPAEGFLGLLITDTYNNEYLSDYVPLVSELPDSGFSGSSPGSS